MSVNSHGGSGLGAENNFDEVDRVDDDLLVGPDGINYPAHSKHSSGVRFKAVMEEVQRQIEQCNEDGDYGKVIADSRQLQDIVDDADALGEATVPDLQVLERWQSQQPRPDKAVLEVEQMLTQAFRSQVQRSMSWVEALINREAEERSASLSSGAEPQPAVELQPVAELPNNNDNFGLEDEQILLAPTIVLSEEEITANLDELRKWRSTLKPMRRAVHLVEKHFGYQCPWWDSPHTLVRVWGQLDCALQVFSDERMVRDLVEVLGSQAVIADSQPREGRLYGFAYLTENAERLKKMIRAKYPEHNALFNAIILKHNNSE